jgi:hypothetical protein
VQAVTATIAVLIAAVVKARFRSFITLEPRTLDETIF